MLEPKEADIVILGDSRAGEGDWKKILNSNSVRNCGIGGITTHGFLDKIDTVYKYRPKKCILQIGINDIRSNANNDTTLLYYSAIIENLLKHGVRPIVTSTIPLRADYWSDLVDYKVVNVRTDSLNTSLVKICKEKGIEYVDINKALADNNRLKRQYTYDGIHLNDSGYILAGKLIQQSLTKN